MYNLVKRWPTRDASWCLEANVNGQRLRVTLGTNVAVTAQEIAINNYIKPALHGREAPRRVPKAAPTTSTLGEVFAVYRQISTGKIPDRTVHCNLVAMRLIVRRGLGNDSMADHEVEAKPASVLTGKLVAAYEDHVHKAAKRAGRDPESTKRTVASYLRHARSLFKKTALPRYGELGITLPDLSEFMNRAVERAVVLERVPVDDKVISRTMAAAAELRLADPAAYIAWSLGFSSLRRGEVSRMQWSWLTRINGAPIDEGLWAELEAYRKVRQVGHDTEEESYVIPSPRIGQGGPGARLRGQNVFRRVNQWMRKLGWTTNHTLHEMRALMLSRIRDDHGLDVAQAFGRHRDQRTTQQSYVGVKSLQGVTVRLPHINTHN
jgi:integrase